MNVQDQGLHSSGDPIRANARREVLRVSRANRAQRRHGKPVSQTPEVTNTSAEHRIQSASEYLRQADDERAASELVQASEMALDGHARDQQLADSPLSLSIDESDAIKAESLDSDSLSSFSFLSSGSVSSIPLPFVCFPGEPTSLSDDENVPKVESVSSQSPAANWPATSPLPASSHGGSPLPSPVPHSPRSLTPTSVPADMPVASTTFIAEPILTPPATSGLRVLQAEFDRSQIADQPRVPWSWSTTGKKCKEPYKPTTKGKWWFDWAHEHEGSLSVISNIGRNHRD
ncbi:hypothetical protein BGW36DRAFT_461350 [Talaromyces proteolyticus]|uniref:Uncharacterized protein n=1 Tax=Talaromyces proteolyticus TaxID=1131652 RepID=A0AAD4KW11_9EURO|nr:uncharacterized protein BGW36DRAFT_461350 [Talaromyces proteolyticus]KAH8697344.1 hypothetical protein BGW36DRAFT_461350 [Talaromyces proteolyticus]